MVNKQSISRESMRIKNFSLSVSVYVLRGFFCWSSFFYLFFGWGGGSGSGQGFVYLNLAMEWYLQLTSPVDHLTFSCSCWFNGSWFLEFSLPLRKDIQLRHVIDVRIWIWLWQCCSETLFRRVILILWWNSLRLG